MQKNQITPYAIICWFMALLFALMQFDLQMIQGFFTSELSQEFNLNHVGIANLSSDCLSWAYHDGCRLRLCLCWVTGRH